MFLKFCPFVALVSYKKKIYLGRPVNEKFIAKFSNQKQTGQPRSQYYLPRFGRTFSYYLCRGGPTESR